MRGVFHLSRSCLVSLFLIGVLHIQKRAEWSIERENELFHPLITKSLSVSIAYEWHKSRYCCREKLLVHLPVYTHSLTIEEHSYLTIQSIII